MQRLERLKQQAAARKAAAAAAAGGGGGGEADEVEVAAREVLESEAAVPAIQLPRKRRLAETIAALEAVSEGEESEEGGSDGEGLLDWRAKRSAR